MAKRNGSNVVGDLNELRIAQLLLEHGVAINSLNSSDTGWDLHCHAPEGLFKNASKAGAKSWTLSGRSAHIQVKTAAVDSLAIDTVQGWVTGTAYGVPTFLFWHQDDVPEFSTPSDLDSWLDSASKKVDEAKKNARNNEASREPEDSTVRRHIYTLRGKETEKQTPLATHKYREDRFPSVLQLWIRFPQLAMAYPYLTEWMNLEGGSESPLEEITQTMANAVWADEQYGRDTDDWKIQSSLESLYQAAGIKDSDARVSNYLQSGAIHALTIGDHKYTRDTVDLVIARLIDSGNPLDSAIRVLEDLVELQRASAAPLK